MATKARWALSGIALIGICIAGSALYAQDLAGRRTRAAVAQYTQALTQALEATLARQDSAVVQLRRRFEEVDDLKTAQELQLRRYRNADHLQAARALGVGRVEGVEDIQRLVAEGQLVPLTDTLYYQVQELDYSVPYVTPGAARLLRVIGARFHQRLAEEGLPHYRYEISSVLRTGDNQRALARINPNATRGVSTHEFGTTLDVVFHTYHYLPRPADTLRTTPYPFLNDDLERLRVRAYEALGMRYWQELQGILGRVLIELQEEGKVLVILEREQPVFHLTVAEEMDGAR